MPNPDLERLRGIKTFPSLVKYLREDLDWPIESEDFEDLTFDFEPEELGIDPKTSAKIKSISQLRPLTSSQPWGIFFLNFEPKKLPVVALRRILGQLVIKKRASANKADQQTWRLSDLLFLSNYGENEQRQITFAHFSGNGDSKNLPTLKVLGWDDSDTTLHMDYVHATFRKKLRWPNDENNLDAWREAWSSAFTLQHREVIDTSKKLAVKLAGLAQQIRKRANSILSIETGKGPLQKIMSGFKEVLIHDLTEDSFADMYAQTIAYGLLSARITNPKGNNPDELSSQMPITNPFLKELMESFLSVGGRKGKSGARVGMDFDELGVNEVVDLLDNSNMEAVVRDFGDRNPLEDPVIHFYESFLKEYDSEQKVQRGVFYTQRPVVSFIVRSVDEILCTEFGLEDGLADTTTWAAMVKINKDLKIPRGVEPDDPFVQILDPATGTGTFLVEVIDFIYEKLSEKWRNEGNNEKSITDLWNEYVPKGLLPRLHGYELLMAPYAIAHMKIGLKLFEKGYHFSSKKRTQVYLTNALEPAQDFSGHFDFMIPALAKEAEAVNRIKRKKRFTVVIGNPPYARGSSNKGEHIEELMDRYKKAVRSEKNIQPLSDDYIKFIRFSENTIKKAEIGIHGMITNNTFISGRIARGMREALMETFSIRKIINLHGSGKVKILGEKAKADENVFDIMQGVAISLLVRIPSKSRMDYSELIGSRSYKFEKLYSKNISDWVRLQSESPYYFWIPRDTTYADEYAKFSSLSDLFNFHNVSGKPGDDSLLISFAPDEVLSKFRLFKKSLERVPKPKLTEAGRKLASRSNNKPFLKSKIIQYAYRPFDVRYTYYDPKIWTRGVENLHSCLDGRPILLATKLIKDSSFSHVFVSRLFADVIFLSNTSSVNCYSFPSAINNLPDSFNFQEDGNNENIKTEIFSEAIGGTVNSQEAFSYIYSILHSPTYRKRYYEFFQHDFPCIPLPLNQKIFSALVSVGEELVSLHLLESPKVNKVISIPVGQDDFKIDKISYSSSTIWIDKNKTCGFSNIPKTIWEFKVGGHQICEKWLKDRKPKKGQPERILTKDDIAHYQKIIVAISETIRIMAEIDEVIEEHGGWPGAFSK